MQLNFGWVNGSDIAERARDRFAELMREKAVLNVPADIMKAYPTYRIAAWRERGADVVGVLKQLVADFGTEEG
ncbi:MAG: hypothetical protein HYX92_18950 [Chloroflexi bacterium]|nr:hypothetical protein [Chloroflexota bacterium]